MNNQEAFTKSLNGVRGQDYRRATRDGTCAYFVPKTTKTGEIGDRCGVGHLLTENTARKAFGTITAIFSNPSGVPEYELVRQELEGVDVNLLVALQNAHDTVLKPSELYDKYEKNASEVNTGQDLHANFERRMEEIAKQFNLQYDEPETA